MAELSNEELKESLADKKITKVERMKKERRTELNETKRYKNHVQKPDLHSIIRMLSGCSAVHTQKLRKNVDQPCKLALG